jgi:uncharacterized repeat protein (TIGR01451 family)
MKRVIFPFVIVAVLVIMVPLAANLPPATVADPAPLVLECIPDDSFTTTIGNVTTFEAAVSGGDPPYDWLWTVNGDPVASLNNTFSTYTNYTHAFNELGLYTVCVNVTDSLDNKAQCCKNATVVGPLLIIAKIDAPDPVTTGGTLNYTITVTNNGSANATNVTIVDDYDETVLNITDTDGGVDDSDTITWDGGIIIPSGGGFLSYNISATVSPTAPDGYIFNSANVTCAEGVSSSISINTTVIGALNLTCDVSPNPTKGGHPTNFTAAASGGIPPYFYDWDFGDGIGNSTDEDPTYTYAINYTTTWNYTVCVNVTDSSEPKQEKQCCMNVTVNKALSLECDISPNTTRVDQAINCTATASGGVGNYSWLWTVNGIEVSDNQNTTYNFTAVNHTAGIYEVCVNVTDFLGNKRQCCTNITVTGPLNLTCDVSPNPTKGGHTTNFNVTASGGIPPYFYAWDFGDGIGNSTDEDPTYTYTPDYTTAWNYTVCVNVTDSSEPKQEKQCCMNVTVNRPLTLECNVNPKTIKVDQVINCMAGASGGVGNYSWLWTVNGTKISEDQNTTYNFTAVNHTAGLYEVCVNVTDSLGNKEQCCTNVTVNPALSLMLSPKTDINLVGTFHVITARVYDPKPGVNLTWSISGVGNFSGTPGGITNGGGQAYTEITSSTAGTSLVTCAVLGNPSVSDTATKTWIIPERPRGGGGGCPPIKYLTVDWDGKNTTKRLRSNDELALDLLGPSLDGRHSLLLEQDTHAPVVDGETYYLIVIRELEDIPHLPENIEAIMAFNVTPEGAVFDRDIFLTLGFYQSQLPENALEETITIAYYGDVSGVWEPLESTLGEQDSMLTLSAAIDHLNIFAILVEVAPSPPSPAHFVASGLNIETSVEAGIFVTKTGESVTVTANVANDGGQGGTYTVELKLDGETADTEIVTLGAGQSQQVSFTVSGLDYGQHEVEVDGLSDEFTTSRTITWWLIIVIIVAIGLIIWGVLWFRRRRKARQAK